MQTTHHPPALEPQDDHNRKLLAHVHPADWVNPEPAERYNMVVIGAGTAGLVTAAGAAGLGAKVALVERSLMGGDCLNYGCVPSKALIRSARAAAEVRDAGRHGITLPGGHRVDFAAVMERMRRLRAGIAPHDSAERFRDLGIDVFLGDAEFVSPDAVEVGGRTLRFARACIATGGRASAPPIPGLDTIEALTNENLFSLTELPRRLAVIGAGPIGVEMAQTFRRFGSEVTLLETEHGILPREDSDASAVVQAALAEDGVEVLCCGRQMRIEPAGTGARLSVDSHDRAVTLDVDRVLVAVGRRPNVEGLGLEAAGVSHDRTGIVVNDHLQTSSGRIFAAGDVATRFKFTHAADALARIVIRNALFSFLPGKQKASALTIPWCTYSSPELAHVGALPSELEEQGEAFETFRVDLADVDRAILDGETGGFVKAHVRKGKGTLLGATVVAPHAGDLVSELSLGMTHGIGLAGFSSTIHPYPTQSEVLRKLGDAYNKTRLTPSRRRLLTRVFGWLR